MVGTLVTSRAHERVESDPPSVRCLNGPVDPFGPLDPSALP